MRSYEPDSPAARARLLALAMVVDGHLAPSELKVLEDADVLRGLQVDGDLFGTVLDELCSDMLHSAVQGGDVEIGPALLDRLLAEIADPVLRRRMLAAMLRIVEADARVAHAEGILLARACLRWMLPDAMPAALARA